MLHKRYNNYEIPCNKKEMVYIPFGADKGDCPYCINGVLQRDDNVEKNYDSKEGYVCPICVTPFLEINNRLFVRGSIWNKLYRDLWKR